jgi:hypothetical protein
VHLCASPGTLLAVRLSSLIAMLLVLLCSGDCDCMHNGPALCAAFSQQSAGKVLVPLPYPAMDVCGTTCMLKACYIAQEIHPARTVDGGPGAD